MLSCLIYYPCRWLGSKWSIRLYIFLQLIFYLCCTLIIPWSHLRTSRRQIIRRHACALLRLCCCLATSNCVGAAIHGLVWVHRVRRSTYPVCQLFTDPVSGYRAVSLSPLVQWPTLRLYRDNSSHQTLVKCESIMWRDVYSEASVLAIRSYIATVVRGVCLSFMILPSL